VVKSLDRNEVDSIVRRLEGKAYRLALGSAQDPEQAASLLIEAFGQIAPYLPGDGEEQRERRLDRALRAIISRNPWLDDANTMAAHSVPESLHIRVVDLVEERQNDEPLGRRKRLFGAVALALLVGAAGGYLFVRWNALQAARPVVAETSLATNRNHISTQGSLYVRFSKAPAFRPTISIQPSGAVLDPPVWDGHTILLDYSGLQYATTYTLNLQGEYRSQFSDKAQFAQQWRFTTEGYPSVVKLDPADGNEGVFRYGQISIDFDKRPPINPVVTLSPPDGGLTSGSWTGTTWNVLYAGLKPLTTYRASLALNYGVPRANIDRSWTFTTEVGAPPKGVPVLWYTTGSRNSQPPDQPQRFLAMNWNGELVGTAYFVNPSTQTWDGAYISQQFGTYVDGSGTPVLSSATYASVAEDSRTLCAIAGPDRSPKSFPQWLYVGQVGGVLHRVAMVNSNPAMRLGLQGCSAKTNRAIVTESQMGAQIQGFRSIAVVSLSDGRVLYRHTYQAAAYTLVQSRDCLYVAEQVPTTSPDGTVTSITTSIRRLTDGAVVARLPETNVIAFSWDDRRVVAELMDAIGPNAIELLDWQANKVLWHRSMTPSTGAFQPVYAAAQPNGTSMAVALGTATLNGDTDQLWIVSADGTSKEALSSAFYSLFFFAY